VLPACLGPAQPGRTPRAVPFDIRSQTAALSAAPRWCRAVRRRPRVPNSLTRGVQADHRTELRGRQPARRLKLIDPDTHDSEPYDLWTSRAPARFVDRLPYVDRARTASCTGGSAISTCPMRAVRGS
jgi:hypothetical protein